LFSEVLNCSHYPSYVYITYCTQPCVHSHLSPSVTVLSDIVLNISVKYSNRMDKCYVMDVYIILEPSGFFIHQNIQH